MMKEEEFKKLAGEARLSEQEEAILRKLYRLPYNRTLIPQNQDEGNRIFQSATEKFNTVSQRARMTRR